MGLARIVVAHDREQALSLFAAVTTNSTNARLKSESSYSSGAVYLAAADFNRAKQWMNKAVALDPSYSLAFVGRAMASFALATVGAQQTDRLEEKTALVQSAFDDLEKALVLNPNQSLAHYQYAVQLTAVGNVRDALKVIDATKAVVPKDITLSSPEKTAFLKKLAALAQKLNANQ